jgi:hypothetical protein
MNAEIRETHREIIRFYPPSSCAGLRQGARLRLRPFFLPAIRNHS